ncbi:hypothetical protein VU06_00455 [Desulfobulbus sp. F3]|nr:hypothetical protein [Desulfobulbus sp. F3]
MLLLMKYHLWLMIAGLICLVFLPTDYRKRKLFIITAGVLLFSVGYELAMQEPVTMMPARVSRYFSQGGPDHSENAHYYEDPVDRSRKLYK